ncbi:MAG TPA: hypothetical protein VGQ93_11735, partial [Lysobacter sp.]|nr:hypothetical protein [Lysobacter sp.]
LQADAPIILYDPVLGVSEFFMVEFRTRRRPNGGLYDTGVAGTGMCLWQIQQDGNKNPTAIPNVTGNAVVHLGSPSLSLGGNGVWGGGTTTPNLRRLDGTLLPLRIAVRPFNPDDGSITIEWFWAEGIWVDFNYGGFLEFGTFDFPFNTLAEGVAGVPWDGTLWIKPGSTPETMTIAKRMRIEAFSGVVTIGR